MFRGQLQYLFRDFRQPLSARKQPADRRYQLANCITVQTPIYDSEERFSITTSALFQALRSDQKQPLFVLVLGWEWTRFARTNEGGMEKATGERRTAL
jgi:hypothetical protein